MNISKQFAQHLEKLAAHGPQAVEAALLNPPDNGKYIVGLTVDGPPQAHISLTLHDYDRFSAALRRLAVSFGPDEAQIPPTTGLSRWAEKVVQQLSYLEEPLTVLELTPADGVAQLRSAGPTIDDQTRLYWEVVLSLEPQPAATLTRYRWSPELDDREVVVYPVAFATVGRLAQDLAQSLEQAAA